MIVYESVGHEKHHPDWEVRLGGPPERSLEVPNRIAALRRAVEGFAGVRFEQGGVDVGGHIAGLHAYYPFIERTCVMLKEEEWLYPERFLLEPDRPERHDSLLEIGRWCADTVTPLGRHTGLVARGAAGAALAGAAALGEDADRVVYAMIRPPGHHAGLRTFAGHCYYNNAALAARRLSRVGRTAILDFDFHHGDGTQEVFYRDGAVHTCSVHCNPAEAYPCFTGFSDERGEGPGQGKNRNFPLPKSANEDQFARAVEEALCDLATHDPAFLVVSAGFDGHRNDPIGGYSGVGTDVYTTIGNLIRNFGRHTLVVQEGGYDPAALEACARAFFVGLLNGV